MDLADRNLAQEFETFVRSRAPDEVIKHGDVGWVGCGCALDTFVNETPGVTHVMMECEMEAAGLQWIWEILNHRGEVCAASSAFAVIRGKYMPNYQGVHEVNTYGKLAECFDFLTAASYLNHLIDTGR